VKAAKVRLDLQYDGAGFHGWAVQPGVRTVQGSLEEALATVVGSPVPSLAVAGRTDAGVHARRQVVSLSLPDGLDLARLAYSLDALTTPDLSVGAVTRVAPGFDARRDVLWRSYRYFLSLAPSVSPFLRRYSWHARWPLDWEAMGRAAALVVGSHDLTAFTPAETEHLFFRRTVLACRWHRRGDLAWLEVKAPTFLRHMVRILVGTMVEVGRGKRSLDSMATLLDGAPRTAAGETAPPHGLFLWRVSYPEESRAGDRLDEEEE
jgi:tRNA pseudouridine38-40 synthase